MRRRNRYPQNPIQSEEENRPPDEEERKERKEGGKRGRGWGFLFFWWSPLPGLNRVGNGDRVLVSLRIEFSQTHTAPHRASLPGGLCPALSEATSSPESA